MYYPDMSSSNREVKSGYATPGVDAVYVGWLEPANEEIIVGDTPQGFKEKVAKICHDPKFVHESHRGFHVCPVCKKSTSSRTLLIPSSSGVAYYVPQMISHYVSEHGYKPPEEFIGDVMDMKEDKEVNDEEPEEKSVEWRKLSMEEENRIREEMRESLEAKARYAVLRDKIDKEMESLGVDDYELFGAGKRGEELPVVEYRGALRAIGPKDSVLAETFIRTIQKLAGEAGYKINMDRPPSEPPAIKGRPVLYVYNSYKTFWPTSEEMKELAASCAVGEGMTNIGRFYENRISQLASEITDDPHGFEPKLHVLVSRQIRHTPEFSILREEIRDANQRLMFMRRSLDMPVVVGDTKYMMSFLAESRGGNIYIDILGCPEEIKQDTILALSRSILA